MSNGPIFLQRDGIVVFAEGDTMRALEHKRNGGRANRMQKRVVLRIGGVQHGRSNGTKWKFAGLGFG